MSKVHFGSLSLKMALLFSIGLPAYAQTLVPTDGTIGALKFTAQMPRTWNGSKAALDKAREVLAKDQVQLSPAFAFEGPKGNLVIGTWKELKPGVVFTASQLNADPPQFPDDWGVFPKNLMSLTGATDSGLEYSGFSVLGSGDGRNFGKGKPVRTFGAWFDLPITYQDSRGVHSGLASVYYRSTEAESTNASAGVRFTQNILANLQLQPGVVKITSEQYKSALNNKNEASPSQSSLKTELTAAQIESPVNSVEMKVNSKSMLGMDVGVFYNEKGVLFCYNYGIVTQAPCALSQPGGNKAEVNPSIINQLNAIASRKIN